MDTRPAPHETRLTRLPSKQLLLDYLQLYIDKRSPDRQSTGNYLKDTAEQGASYLTGNASANVTLNKLVTDAQLQIKNAKDWNDWYNLIKTFRHFAELAQKQKTIEEKENESLFSKAFHAVASLIVKEEESLLRQTFHAMASLIVCELMECTFEPGTEDAKKYDNILYKKMDELKQELNTNIEHGKRSVHDKQGLTCEHYLEIENELLRELAYACDIDAIHEGSKHHLFDHLRPPKTGDAELLKAKDSANHCGPFCLQRKYAEWIYSYHYQPLEQKEFSSFKSKAYIHETLEIDNEIKKNELELKSIEERRKVEAQEFDKQKKLKGELERQQLTLNASGQHSGHAKATTEPEPAAPNPGETDPGTGAPAQVISTNVKVSSVSLPSAPASTGIQQTGLFSPASPRNDYKLKEDATPPVQMKRNQTRGQ